MSHGINAAIRRKATSMRATMEREETSSISPPRARTFAEVHLYLS
jgi:hypothetical protein